MPPPGSSVAAKVQMDGIVVLESSDLRVLDAALWTYAVKPDSPLTEDE